jgi:hypothetical protein
MAGNVNCSEGVREAESGFGPVSCVMTARGGRHPGGATGWRAVRIVDEKTGQIHMVPIGTLVRSISAETNRWDGGHRRQISAFPAHRKMRPEMKNQQE